LLNVQPAFKTIFVRAPVLPPLEPAEPLELELCPPEPLLLAPELPLAPEPLLPAPELEAPDLLPELELRSPELLAPTPELLAPTPELLVPTPELLVPTPELEDAVASRVGEGAPELLLAPPASEPDGFELLLPHPQLSASSMTNAVAAIRCTVIRRLLESESWRPALRRRRKPLVARRRGVCEGTFACGHISDILTESVSPHRDRRRAIIVCC
jgi:hypothetical protein